VTHYGNTIAILKNKGDGTFADEIDYGGGGNSIFASDLDRDGDEDLALANGSSTVKVLINLSNPGYSQGDIRKAIWTATGD